MVNGLGCFLPSEATGFSERDTSYFFFAQHMLRHTHSIIGFGKSWVELGCSFKSGNCSFVIFLTIMSISQIIPCQYITVLQLNSFIKVIGSSRKAIQKREYLAAIQ